MHVLYSTICQWKGSLVSQGLVKKGKKGGRTKRGSGSGIRNPKLAEMRRKATVRIEACEMYDLLSEMVDQCESNVVRMS